MALVVEEYRISKYSPNLRSDDGVFHGDDWTSISDIGGEFAGRLLTPELYMASEDSYVRAIVTLVVKAADDVFSVEGLESYDDGLLTSLPRSARALTKLSPSLSEREQISGERLLATIRANLRDLVWCRLEHSDGRFVHFGQELYVYIRTPQLPDLSVLPSGIYVEPCDSPIGK